jgi:hypothetical protein
LKPESSASGEWSRFRRPAAWASGGAAAVAAVTSVALLLTGRSRENDEYLNPAHTAMRTEGEVKKLRGQASTCYITGQVAAGAAIALGALSGYLFATSAESSGQPRTELR